MKDRAMGEMIKLKSQSDGFEFDAYHADPGDARRGGLIVVQEIFGVTAGIKQIADSFAQDGYEVIAPSMFDRSERGLDVAIPEADFQKLIGYAQASFAHAVGDIQACVDALKPPVFITGFCYGGSMAWLAAARCTGLSAASAFYGSAIATDGLALEPKCPVILHFGRKDQHIPPEHWAKIEAAHPDVPIHLYDADHGFFSPDRPPSIHDPDSARLARLRTLQLFHQNSGLKGEA
ncbi:MAG TPA: dienelactone hydrolase family protein [Caulobacteraceae bacterium]